MLGESPGPWVLTLGTVTRSAVVFAVVTAFACYLFGSEGHLAMDRRKGLWLL